MTKVDGSEMIKPDNSFKGNKPYSTMTKILKSYSDTKWKRRIRRWNTVKNDKILNDVNIDVKNVVSMTVSHEMNETQEILRNWEGMASE